MPSINSVWSLVERFLDLFKWWITVSPWEQAVRVRLGKHLKLFSGGVHIKIPFIDEYYVQSIRLRITLLPMQTVMTQDGKPLTVGATIAYSIKDIMRLYQTLHHAHDSVRNVAQGVIAQVAHETPYEQLEPIRLGEKASYGCIPILTNYGLGDISVQVTDFISVRTLRLIMDQRGYEVGEYLNTNTPAQRPS